MSIQLNAVVKDQYGNILQNSPVTWVSSAPNVASVSSTGLVAGIAAGQTNITATSTIDTTVKDTITGTVTASAPIVDSIVISPSQFNVNPSGGTQQLFASVKDQYGADMPGETVAWSSQAPTICTVDSSGLVTGLIEGDTLIIATSTSNSGVTGFAVAFVQSIVGPNGEFIMGSNGTTPIRFDTAQHYDSDAEWRQQIINRNLSITPTWVYADPSLNGTGGSNAVYTDGRFVDLIKWQNTQKINNWPSWEVQIVGHNQSGSAPTPELTQYFTPPIKTCWIGRRSLYPAGFTNYGNATSTAGINFNAGQAPGFKIGPYVGLTVDGQRSGLQMVYGYYTIVNAQAVPDLVAAYLTDEFTSGEPYDSLVLLESFSDGGTYYGATSAWKKKSYQGNNSWVAIGPRYVGTSAYELLYNRMMWTTLNYNQSRATTIKCYFSDWCLFDYEDDPFNIGQANAALAPTFTSATTGDSNNSSIKVTVNFTNTRTTATSRLGQMGVRVDGDAGQEYFVDIPKRTQDNTPIELTIATGLSTGTYSVQFFTRSDDGTARSTLSSATTISIFSTPPAAPNAPTAANASVITHNALTFVVTLAATGGLPDTLKARYSTDNATWTDLTDIDLPSVVLGGTVSVVVTGLTPETLYYFQAASKNVTATSTYSASKTGTTNPAPVAAAATYTSALNGFVWGQNFSTCTDDMSLWVALAELGTGATSEGGAARNSLVTDDSTYIKVAKISGDDMYEIGSPDLNNFRLRVIEKYVGWVLDDVISQRRYEIQDYNGVAAFSCGIYPQPGTNIVMEAGIINKAGYSDPGVANALVSGNYQEIIFEYITETDGKITCNYYQNIPGATREVLASFTSDTPISPALPINQLFIGHPTLKTGKDRYVALIEVCNARDGGGAIIPIANLGT